MVMYMISASLHRVRLITDHQVPVQNILSFRSKASKTIRADRRRQAARFARLAEPEHMQEEHVSLEGDRVEAAFNSNVFRGQKVTINIKHRSNPSREKTVFLKLELLMSEFLPSICQK